MAEQLEQTRDREREPSRRQNEDGPRDRVPHAEAVRTWDDARDGVAAFLEHLDALARLEVDEALLTRASELGRALEGSPLTRYDLDTVLSTDAAQSELSAFRAGFYGDFKDFREGLFDEMDEHLVPEAWQDDLDRLRRDIWSPVDELFGEDEEVIMPCVEPAPSQEVAPVDSTAQAGDAQCEPYPEMPSPEERERWRQEADAARERNLARDAELKRAMLEQAPAATNRIVVGGGFAAVLNYATLPEDQRGQSNMSPPQVVGVGFGDPWAKRGELAMGQAPHLLSVPGFHFPPSHLMKDPDARFLPSESYGQAIQLTKDAHGFAVFEGWAGPIEVRNEGGADGAPVQENASPAGYDADVPWEFDAPYRLPVAGEGVPENFYIYAERIDIAGGPGPARRLAESQLDEDDDTDLRKVDERVGYARLLDGDDHVGNPVPQNGEHVLVFGGGASAAWNYDHADTQGGTTIWAARKGVRQPDDPPEWDEKRIAFRGAYDAGERNEETLARSEDSRYVADVGKMKPVRDDQGIQGVEIEFTDNAPPQRVFQQVVLSIGQDETRAGGPVDLSKYVRDVVGFVPIYEKVFETQTGDPMPFGRPLGIQSKDKRIRLLGSAAAQSARRLLSRKELEKFQAAFDAHLKTLPVETQVPVGITLAGVMIYRANRPAMGDCEIVNLNTASASELATLAPDFDAQAHAIINFRKADERPTGFTSVEQLKSIEGVSDELFEQLKDRVRI